MGGSNPAYVITITERGQGCMQQNLQRNHAMTFRVTEKERDMIRRKMEQSGIISLRGYLLKMAVDGRVIRVELESVKKMNRLLSNATSAIEQITERINETGRAYAADLDDIKARQEEIWVQQKEILNRLNKVLEVAK